MSITEAPFNRPDHREQQPTWSAQEAIHKLAELQGRHINMVQVLESQRPDHAHYGLLWYKNQSEPDEVRLGILEILKRPLTQDRYREVEYFYEQYFRSNELETRCAAAFASRIDQLSGLGLNVYNRGDMHWPPEIAVRLLPMLDFSVQFPLTDSTIPRESHTWGVTQLGSPFINTTRVEGTYLYEVDLALGKDIPRNEVQINQYFQPQLIPKPHLGLLEQRSLDSFSISQKGQTLITVLMDARV